MFYFCTVKFKLSKYFSKEVKKGNSANPDMIKVYTDTQGQSYYTYKNPLQLPAIRTIAVERATRYANMFISESTLTQLIAEIKAAGNKQDWVKVFSIIQELEFRQKFLSEENSLLEVAQYYFLTEDENPEILNEKLLSDKIQVWKSDPAARAFFLQIALKYIQKYSDISMENLLPYLQANENNEKRIYQFISPNI